MDVGFEPLQSIWWCGGTRLPTCFHFRLGTLLEYESFISKLEIEDVVVFVDANFWDLSVRRTDDSGLKYRIIERRIRSRNPCLKTELAREYIIRDALKFLEHCFSRYLHQSSVIRWDGAA